MQLFSTKTGFPLKCRYNFLGQFAYFLDRNVINEMYLSRNVENIDKMGTFFLYCYLKKIFEKSSMEMKLSVEKTSREPYKI